MGRIEIYTTRYCPYCHAAKRLLTALLGRAEAAAAVGEASA
jgi:glutaredoxin